MANNINRKGQCFRKIHPLQDSLYYNNEILANIIVWRDEWLLRIKVYGLGYL